MPEVKAETRRIERDRGASGDHHSLDLQPGSRIVAREQAHEASARK